MQGVYCDLLTPPLSTKDRLHPRLNVQSMAGDLTPLPWFWGEGRYSASSSSNLRGLCTASNLLPHLPHIDPRFDKMVETFFHSRVPSGFSAVSEIHPCPTQTCSAERTHWMLLAVARSCFCF